MADVVSKEVRSRMMAGIKGKNTKPEVLIRKGLHGLGFRYRLHVKGLPGTPDLMFSRYRAVIFVNGCFWHGHDCHLFRWPKTRAEFWRKKIGRNVEKDRAARVELNSLGWRVAEVWECALKGKHRLEERVVFQSLADWLCSNEGLLIVRGTEN